MVKDVVNKITLLIKRRKNAKKFEVKFTRASEWEMPEKILLNNKVVDLNFVDPKGASPVFIDILLDDTYGLGFFGSYFKNIKNIIDVGANQGLFILGARSIFPDAQIHSYEPNADVIKSLEYHAVLAGSKFFNEAVGQVDGLVNLHLDGANSLTTRTELNDAGSVQQVSIKKCIDRIGGNVDILKLDCEGAEWEILKDPAQLKNVKAITLEYHLDGIHDHKSILRILEAANFKVVHYAIMGSTWGMTWAINNLNLKK